MRNDLARALGAIGVLALLACDSVGPTGTELTPSSGPADSTAADSSGNGGPRDSIRFLSVPANAPALAADSIAFWAVQGEDSEVELDYLPDSSGNSSRFLRFRVREETQIVRPDGTSLADGDSILITIRVVDPTRLLTKFEPAGLRFDGGGSARLNLSYAETSDDLDDDDDERDDNDDDDDGKDDDIERLLSIFRRETDLAPWFKVASTLNIEDDELEATITGFTNYVIAY